MSRFSSWLREKTPVRLLHQLPPGVTVGRHTYGLTREKVFFVSESAPLNVGAFCSIARGVSFMCSEGSHLLESATTFPIYSRLMDTADPVENGGRPCGITIANDVWIGQNAMIMPGVSVGDGAVIGACAVVTRDVPPYAIVGGVPAKFIRTRFSQDIVAKMLAIQWWLWDDEKIKHQAPLLTGSIETFIERHFR